jgi:hypothetical protein
MKLYFLFDEIDFGRYAGMPLTEVFKIDPAYIDQCICGHHNDFAILSSELESLKKLNPGFVFSDEAIKKAKEAEQYFASEDDQEDFRIEPEEEIE